MAHALMALAALALLLAVVYAASAYALVRVVRKLPWVERRLDRKPWGCDPCMSAWSGLAFALAAVAPAWILGGLLVAVITLAAAAPASGMVLLLLDWSAAHAPAPPVLPEG